MVSHSCGSSNIPHVTTKGKEEKERESVTEKNNPICLVSHCGSTAVHYYMLVAAVGLSNFESDPRVAVMYQASLYMLTFPICHKIQGKLHCVWVCMWILDDADN